MKTKQLFYMGMVVLLIATSCQNSQKTSLTAAGATFPLPFYNMVFKSYSDTTSVQVTYGGIGSGGGIRSLKDQVVDFGATDAFLTDEQKQDLPAEIVHIPTCIGAVAIAYNLPAIDSLKLTPELLEKIFMGQITKWNDPLLQSVNTGTVLPDEVITVVTRSDGSGTTHIFSDYMSKVSRKWADEVGTGNSLKWPAGISAKGNPGVAGTVSQTAGSIGYIGSEFASSLKIQVAAVQNSARQFLKPGVKSISAAAQGDIPEDTRVMLTNSSTPDSYPISGFTWIILYKEQAYGKRSQQQALETVKLLKWLVSEEVQKEAEKVHYASLPGDAAAKAKTILESVTYQGEKILK